MSERRSRTRRKQRNDGPGAQAQYVWLERLWAIVARPWFIGVALVIAGIVVMLAPTATVPPSPSYGWWIAAYRFSNASQGAVTLLVVASLLALALGVESWRARKARPGEVFVLGLMGAGIVMGLLTWFVAQADVPTSRVAVAPGQTIEAYPAIESGRAFKVMLPTRIFVSDVDPEAGKATVELRRPGENGGVVNDVFVGDPLEVTGYQLALVGLELDPRARSAVLTMPGGIERRASLRSKVRFTPDGQEYEVRRITSNYLGVMGPAVELATGEDDIFWVTQRGSELENPLHEIRLLRLEAAPVPVFSLTKTNVGATVPAAGTLFAFGLALFLLRRGREDDPEEAT